MEKLTKEDIISEGFNTDLYLKIRRKREELGLKTYADYNPENGLIENHPFKNREIKDLKTGKIQIIENVYRHWVRGYYLMLLVYHLTESGHRSHGTIYWKNISSHEPVILKIIEENNLEYQIL